MKMKPLVRALREFLTLGIIIAPLPYNIANGAPIDAIPVMANFNAIVGQVNANAAALVNIPTNLPTHVTVVGGTANAITLTPSPAIGSYVVGQRFTFQSTAANTSAVTVNVSGLGVQPLYTKDGQNLSGEEIHFTGLCEILLTGSGFMLLNSESFDVVTGFVPVLAFGGSSAGITYASNAGNYMKVGRMIFYWLKLLLTNKGAAVGVATVGGFPFNINTQTGAIPSNSVPFGHVTFNTVTTTSTTPVVPIPINTTATCQFAYQVLNIASPPNPLDNTSFANASQIFMSGMYPI